MSPASVTPPPGEAAVPAPFPDGFHPFWFWNDRITAENIRRQIARMSEQGIRGFFIHSRQGLQQPYMSSGFLDLVEVAMAEGQARNMSVHLYDEYPYPSGAAGGGVVQSDIALAGTTLQVNHWALQAGPVRVELPPGRVLVCRAFALRQGEVDWDHWLDLSGSIGMVLTRESYHDAGVQAYNDRRFFADSPVPVLEVTLSDGPVELWAVSEVPVSHHKYWGSFPDVTNPLAVRRFMELTHERYRHRLGPRLAGIASIFVDEVEPRPSASVIAELERRHGDDVAGTLMAFAAPAHPSHIQALREMQEVCLQLFEKSFEAPIAAWCRRNGVRYSGEKPSLRLSQLAWMDIPGCEPGHTKAGAPCSDLLQAEIRGNAKATASAAYFYAKEGSLCECYHSLGWGATLQDAKLIAESLLLLGTRWLVPHAFFYSIDGLRKHDAPPSFFHMPYWRMFGELSRRVSAIAGILDGTWLDASIGVVEPTGGLPDSDQLACYERLQLALLGAHLDFLTVDHPILSAGSLVDGSVALRDVRLRSVLVPPMRDPEPSLDEWLGKFEHAGGQVVRVVGPEDIDDVIARLRAHCPPLLSITAHAGDASSVLVACRRGVRGRHWLMVNTSSGPVDLHLALGGDAGLVPAPLESPWVRGLVRQRGRYELRLEGFESALINDAPASSRTARSGAAGSRPPALRVATEGPWALHAENVNVLRLGRWLMSFPEQGHAAAIVEPAPIANQLLRSRMPFAPKIVDHFGSSPSVGFPEMLVRYESAFDCYCQGELQLLMQPGALAGEWQIWADGFGPYGPEAFTTAPGPVDGCVGRALVPIAAGGSGWGGSRHRHLIVVEVRTHDGANGLRDCLYVGGDFGVFGPPWPTDDGSVPGEVGERAPVLATLGPRPEAGELGAWAANGLPYYAGAIEYSRLLPLRPDGDSEEVEVELALPKACEDAAEIAFGTGPFRPLVWSPRRTLVPREELGSGKGPTAVRVRILSTLERTFEGRQFDPGTHAYRDIDLAPLATRPFPGAGGAAS